MGIINVILILAIIIALPLFLIVGLVSPSLISLKMSRIKVFAIYILSTLLCFILFGVLTDIEEQGQNKIKLEKELLLIEKRKQDSIYIYSQHYKDSVINEHLNTLTLMNNLIKSLIDDKKELKKAILSRISIAEDIPKELLYIESLKILLNQKNVYNDKNINNINLKLKENLINYQIIVFPILREKFIQICRNTFWEKLPQYW
jgi:hypothetical protein